MNEPFIFQAGLVGTSATVIKYALWIVFALILLLFFYLIGEYALWVIGKKKTKPLILTMKFRDVKKEIQKPIQKQKTIEQPIEKQKPIHIKMENKEEKKKEQVSIICDKCGYEGEIDHDILNWHKKGYCVKYNKKKMENKEQKKKPDFFQRVDNFPKAMDKAIKDQEKEVKEAVSSVTA